MKHVGRAAHAVLLALHVQAAFAGVDNPAAELERGGLSGGAILFGGLAVLATYQGWRRRQWSSPGSNESAQGLLLMVIGGGLFILSALM